MKKIFTIATLVAALFAFGATVAQADVSKDNYLFSNGVTLNGESIAVATSAPEIKLLQVSKIWSEQDEIGASCKETGDRCKKSSECCSGLTCSGSNGKNYCY